MIRQVTIIPSDEEHSPPDEVVELAVIGSDVFLTVASWKEDGKGVRTEHKIHIRPLALNDLLRALACFSPVGGAIHETHWSGDGS